MAAAEREYRLSHPLADRNKGNRNAGSDTWTFWQRAIVTGSIARSTVDLLTAHGVRVVAEDINPAVHELAKDDEVVALVGDTAEEAIAVRIVKLALESFGRLDVLVNNAGKTLNKPLLDNKPLLETSLVDWDSIMAIKRAGSSLLGAVALNA